MTKTDWWGNIYKDRLRDRLFVLQGSWQRGIFLCAAEK